MAGISGSPAEHLNGHSTPPRHNGPGAVLTVAESAAAAASRGRALSNGSAASWGLAAGSTNISTRQAVGSWVQSPAAACCKPLSNGSTASWGLSGGQRVYS